MVVEYSHYEVSNATAVALEEAYVQAAKILDADPHRLIYEVARGIEELEFFMAVQPFISEIQEIRHCAIGRTGGAARS